jgi:signal recognition particle subunit SEC65
MLAQVGYAIFLSGNKVDPTSGTIVLADGVREEYELAKTLGVVPIPVGATGFMAKEIWDEVSADPDKYYPGIDIKSQLQVLGDENNSNQQIVDAIFDIIRITTSKT